MGTLLGSGGAASVYAAFDEELNRPVAIKFVSARQDGTPVASGLWLREARAASALNHPNIIMVFDVIETSETAAIVMELVKVSRSVMPPGRTLLWMRSSNGAAS